MQTCRPLNGIVGHQKSFVSGCTRGAQTTNVRKGGARVASRDGTDGPEVGAFSPKQTPDGGAREHDRNL